MAAPGAPAAQQHPRLGDFSIGSLISKGAFGAVYKCVRRTDGKLFALKLVNLADLTRMDKQEAIDEARVLAQLNHQHIIRHYDSFIDSSNQLNILMEFAPGGDLATRIKANGRKPLPEDFVWKVLIQSTLALNYIHNKRIIHRDIKALNIFFDSRENVKLGDFGIARPLGANSNFAQSKVGTLYYLSPELCSDKPYNIKSDVWALGVVMYECMMGKYPFDAANEGALIRKIVTGQFQPIAGAYSQALVSMAMSLLTYKPESRPDTNKLLQNQTLLSKARALSIDLYPGPHVEDPPVIEAPPQAPQQVLAPPGVQGAWGAPQGPSPQQHSPQVGHPFGSPGPHGRPSSAAQQHPQSPYGQQQRVPGAPDHPFAAHGQGGGRGAAGGPIYPQSPQPDPYGAQGLALEVHKVHISDTERARHNVDRLQNLQANALINKQDQAKGVIYQGPQDSGPKPVRMRPEELPAAGARPSSAKGGAPYALHAPGSVVHQSVNGAVMQEATWHATYQPPQFGRRRCPELQITGPNMRVMSASGYRGGGGGRAADDATTYVSTSYVTSYQR